MSEVLSSLPSVRIFALFPTRDQAHAAKNVQNANVFSHHKTPGCNFPALTWGSAADGDVIDADEIEHLASCGAIAALLMHACSQPLAWSVAESLKTIVVQVVNSSDNLEWTTKVRFLG